jgi:hypothetical protein
MMERFAGAESEAMTIALATILIVRGSTAPRRQGAETG